MVQRGEIPTQNGRVNLGCACAFLSLIASNKALSKKFSPEWASGAKFLCLP